MSWNSCLYAYAQKRGGEYWGTAKDRWDGLLHTDYQGEPLLIRAVATGVGRYEAFYSLSAAFQITLERSFTCKITREKTVVQGAKTALSQVKRLAPQLPFGEDYGCPEISGKRIIKTSDKPFTKRVLSSIDLRQDLLDMPPCGIVIAPLGPDSRYHQVSAMIDQDKTYQFLSLGAEAVSLTPEELQQVSEDFESGLDKLIRLAWSARKAATAWPMGG